MRRVEYGNRRRKFGINWKMSHLKEATKRKDVARNISAPSLGCSVGEEIVPREQQVV